MKNGGGFRGYSGFDVLEVHLFPVSEHCVGG